MTRRTARTFRGFRRRVASGSSSRLHRRDAVVAQRGVHNAKLIKELSIGYARGGNLRVHLKALGYVSERLRHAGA